MGVRARHCVNFVERDHDEQDRVPRTRQRSSPGGDTPAGGRPSSGLRPPGTLDCEDAVLSRAPRAPPCRRSVDAPEVLHARGSSRHHGLHERATRLCLAVGTGGVLSVPPSVREKKTY